MSMRVWGVHMPREIGAAALKANQVLIGWSQLGDLTKIPPNREAIKQALRTALPDRKAGAIPVDAGSIYRFCHEMAPGDLIVYPSKHDRQVNIGRIKGAVAHVPGLSVDDEGYETARHVDWLAHVPRQNFSQSALNEIGSAVTFFAIKNHPAEFIRAAGLSNDSAPTETVMEEDAVDDDTASSDASKRAQENTEDFVIRRLYENLSGHEFEHFVAHLLTCMGYSARVTQASGDGGVDIIAHKDALGFEPPIIKVQCKRKTDQIREPEVRELLGTLVEGEYGLFVCLGTFDRKVYQSERLLSRLRLIGAEEIVALVYQHYAKFDMDTRKLLPLKQIFVADV